MICPLFIVSFLIAISNQQHFNNVCKKLEAYRTIDTNPECWYDPDVGADAAQIALNNGYKLEYHQVVTEDGYILTIFHISNREDGPPILLHHGLFVDGTIFMLLKNESLAFYLSDQGYDVWVTNFRGSQYSTNHIKFTIYDKAFWDFSFHEMGYYDTPAIIDYIKTKNNRKITIIGHSMGTTVSFVYASTRLQHAEKNIKSIISLAPVVYVAYISISKLVVQYYDLLYSFLSPLSSYGIGNNLKLSKDLLDKICSMYPAFVLCAGVFETLGGYNPQEIRPEVRPLRFTLTLSGVSFKTMIHYGQLMVSNSFENYDYGKFENLKRYGSVQPPKYDLDKITLPVYLFYGKNDLLGDEKDVHLLYDRLQTTTKSIQSVLDDGSSKYAHEDFLVGKSVVKLYKQILQKLR